MLGASIALALCAIGFRLFGWPSSVLRGALVASAVVAACAFFGHVAAQLGSAIPEVLQLLAWAAIVACAAIYAMLAKGSLPTLTAALNVFTGALVLIALLPIAPTGASRVARASEGEPLSDDVIAVASRWPDRDIYFLNFDRYGSDWSLDAFYDIDNDLYPDLEAVGFQVIPGARANYRATDLSLAATLNLRLLDDLTESVGRDSGDRVPARELLDRHEVGNFLRHNGYRYYHLGAWWEPTRSSAIADEVRSLGKTTEFASVLREGTILPTLERLSGQVEELDTASRVQHREQALFALRQVRQLAQTPGRKFVFAHILLPHPPFVLAEGGRHVLEEEAESKDEAQLFEQQLHFTNDQIRRTVATLLEGPDERDPIIILSADEGPYLCGENDDMSCVERDAEAYGIRYGVLRAYYLPGLDYEVPADDSGVNIFRTIFREYFGADLPDLPNRSYDFPDKQHLYDFRDITDELPLPSG